MDNTDMALAEKRDLRKEARDRLKKQVAKLVSEGLARTDILQRLQISGGYYYKLVNEMRAEGFLL